MGQMMGRCGLVCTECEGFVATQNNDMRKLQEMAEKWGKSLGKEIPVEGLLCDGCIASTGRMSGYCNMCQIRKCVNEKGFSTCAECDDFACETLSGFFAQASKAKQNLETLTNG